MGWLSVEAWQWQPERKEGAAEPGTDMEPVHGSRSADVWASMRCKGEGGGSTKTNLKQELPLLYSGRTGQVTQNTWLTGGKFGESSTAQ